MAESSLKGSIFAALRALQEVPQDAADNAPPPQAPPAPLAASAPPSAPSSDLIKGVESRLEAIEKKISGLGNIPNLDKLQQMQERAIQAEVALREREKSQEAARRETEALLQNLAAQRRLEESDRQMKDNLAYCRRRIEELEARKPESPAEVPQEDISQKIEERVRPLSEALSRLEIQNEKLQKALLEIKERDAASQKALKENANKQMQSEEDLKLLLKNLRGEIDSQISAILKSVDSLKEENERKNETLEKMEKKFRNLEGRVDSFFAYQAELSQALLENKKAAAAAQFQAKKTEETLKNTLKQMDEKAEAKAEELKKIASSLGDIIPLTQSLPVSGTENSSDDLESLEQDFQKILSVIDAGFSAPPDK
jgi:DNA repair exonuclease SbcCD ATPase subunit